MTSFRTHATSPDPARDAERLGDAWDALVAGRRPIASDIDAELLSVVEGLHVQDSPTRPTLPFRNHLRETLMHVIAPTAALPAPTLRPVPNLGRPVEIGQPLRRNATTLPSRLQRAGMRWAAIAALIALVLASVAGGYLAGLEPGDGDPPTRVSGFQAASPEASPMASNDYANDYSLVGSGLIVGSLYPDATDGVTDVQIQSWRVDPGERATFEPTSDPPRGIGVDIVIDGAYAATFSGIVTITRPEPLAAAYEYPLPGTLVELSTGDSVSYEFGSRIEIVNPLETRTLAFKSIVFGIPKGGDEPPSHQLVGGDIEITVDGRGTLPRPLSEYPNRDAVIDLTYSLLVPDGSLPPEIARGLVLGPVGPLSQARSPEGTDETEGTEGYYLWVFETAR